MSLRHLLWRLSENKTTPVELTIRAFCVWPLCDLGNVSLTMVLRPTEAKPEQLSCNLCGRALHVVSAGPLQEEMKWR